MHKINAKIIAVSLITLFIIITAAYSFLAIYNYPDEINLMQGQSHRLKDSILCKLVLEDEKDDSIILSNLKSKLASFTLINGVEEGNVKATLKMFNILPVKTVTVNVVPNKELIPSGEAIGVKIQTKGVLVVGLSSITAVDGKKYSPAADAGFEIGDTILEINGQKTEKDRDITNIVNENKNSVLSFLIEREGKKHTINVKPVQSLEDSVYRVGLWVRDNIAGVGTMTFYDPETYTFGALGHGITDVDSGVMVDISSGSIMKAKVASVQKAKKTVPGEIVGIFYDNRDNYGKIKKNTNFGIYGTLNHREIQPTAKPMPIALSHQVREGPAKILSTVEGNKVEAFDIEIQKVNRQNIPDSKSMLIKITDKRLLDKTGGIVQGMSGSPIIQDGRIVGAVTHVLVNDPSRGYGIFIEWMLKEADIKLESSIKAVSGQ